MFSGSPRRSLVGRVCWAFLPSCRLGGLVGRRAGEDVSEHRQHVHYSATLGRTLGSFCRALVPKAYQYFLVLLEPLTI